MAVCLLGLNDFDASLAEGFQTGLRGLGVGDDGVDLVEFAEVGDGFSAEFGVVQAEDHFLCRPDHFFLDVDEQVVGVGDAFFGDTAGSHNGDVRMDAGKGFHGQRPHQYAQSGVNHSS